MIAKLTKESARKYGSRGGLAKRHTIHVDGEPLAVSEIAARLGVAKSTAQKRIAKAANSGNGITWETLQ